MNRYFKNLRSSKPCRGFTLIELLTVTAIVGILSAILIVVLSNVRESAKSTQSASNLRQWGIALHLYMNQNQGRIPFEGDADGMNWPRVASPANREAWFNVLPPFVDMLPMREINTTADRQALLKQAGIHSCPLVEWRDARQPNFAYMMNSQIYHPAGTGNSADEPVLYSHIIEPAKTVMFADLDPQYNTRPRGRGRHADARHRNGETHIMFFDGSIGRFDAEYVRLDDYSENGLSYAENNKPNIIWNQWIRPREE